VHRPDLIVLAGGQVDDDALARWEDGIARSVGPLPLAVYRRGTPRVCATVLPPAPGEAQLRLAELTEAAIPAPVRQRAG
jgi:hypothetical protein